MWLRVVSYKISFVNFTCKSDKFRPEMAMVDQVCDCRTSQNCRLIKILLYTNLIKL